jgi:hypothetical protein
MLPFARCILLIGAMAAMSAPGVASAQLRISAGAGAGIAGSTDGSLSEGRTAPVVMGQVTAMSTLVGVGVEVDGWRSGASSVLLGTGHLQLHLPSTPLFLTLGAGFGRGDPDGKGTISGTAGQIGARCDVKLPAPLALTLFGNGFLVYAPVRSLQMVDAGLAITRR